MSSIAMKRRMPRWAGIACAAALLGGLLGAAPVAPADAAVKTATVMVKTQRMESPTLKSKQLGWYAKGTKLTLTCAVTNGQSVQGYYSKWMPKGGWSSLWYKCPRPSRPGPARSASPCRDRRPPRDRPT